MRTQKNIVDYFPHDAAASDGDTLTILEGIFGNDGYAFWFKLLEKLARTENHYIDINKDSKWQLFYSKAHITREKAITIVEKLVELEAIDPELWQSGIIWSENLIKNIEPVYKNRRRELPLKPITTCRKAFSTNNPSVPLRSMVTDKVLPVTGKTPAKAITTNSKGITTSRNHKTTGRKAITTSQSRVEYSRVEYSRISLPDFIDKDLWNDYLDMRKKIRKPATIRAQELLIKDLEKLKAAGEDISEIIKKSIKHSWQGLFSLKGGQNGAYKGSPRALPTKYTRPEDL